MNGLDIYKIYAPENTKWTEWVRVVPFVAINTYNREPAQNWLIPIVNFIQKYDEKTAIFVDLPNQQSIEMGIALAKLGYRPIPIFNGTTEQINSQATTNNYLTERALINGAENLKKITLKSDTNPAFLLDSLRTNAFRSKESIFDNSWDIYGQDIPSAKYFKENGITKIIVVGSKIQRDLRKIFFKFQEIGIDLYLTNGYLPIEKYKLTKTLKERIEKEEL